MIYLMKLPCRLQCIHNRKSRKRSQSVIMSSDDEELSSRVSVWLAVYEELPNISENEKRVLKLQTMNSLIIGAYRTFEGAKMACIKYIKKQLNRHDEDFESIEWKEDGWFCDDLIDESDSFQQVYILNHFLQ